MCCSKQHNSTDRQPEPSLCQLYASCLTAFLSLVLVLQVDKKACDRMRHLPDCRWGHTPLQHAVAKRHGPVVELLQKHGARLGYVVLPPYSPLRLWCFQAASGDFKTFGTS